GPRSLFFWDVASGRLLHEVKDCRGPVAFTPDGKHLACGAAGAIRRFDPATYREVRRREGHPDYVIALAFSADGKTLASGFGHTTSARASTEAQLRLWAPAAGRLLRQFPAHLSGLCSLTFAPDGRRLATPGHDARARVWDAGSGRRLFQVRGLESPLKCAAF